MIMTGFPIDLVRVTRGNVTEEIHRGSVAVVQDGKIVYSLGQSNLVTPVRSAAKPFQILPLLEDGGLDQFNLGLDDIAVMVSSHNGEPLHVRQVRSLLSRGGSQESDLKCGIHPPYYSWIVNSYKDSKWSAVNNNCSGKHAGMLLLCTLKGFGVDGYWKTEHPVQQLVLERTARCMGLTPSEMEIALDGCGVPTSCAPLWALATAYHQLAIELESNSQSALCMVGAAMLAHPFLVAGTERVDTELMRLGLIVAKSSSSGVFALALLGLGMGIAIKVESGSEDASECVAVAVLEQLGILSDSDIEALDEYRYPPVKTWTGVMCGRLEPVFDLRT